MRRPALLLLLLVFLSAAPDTAAAQEVVESNHGWTVEADGFRAVVHPSGAISFEDDPPGPGLYLVGVPIFAGAAGLTSGQILVASFGFGQIQRQLDARSSDRHYLAKRTIMNETFEARAAMRARWDANLMADALATLPAYLDAIWSAADIPVAERRRILFALWDECAEEGNALLTGGGAEARRRIEAFIRARLPDGSPDGYAPADLARLNARRTSRAAFDPYWLSPLRD